MTQPLAEHFFRHEYGRLVAMLTCRVGTSHVEAVEDAVQSALVAALEAWTRGSVPQNPSAWLFRVASNQLTGELRQRLRRERIMVQQMVGEAVRRVERPGEQPAVALIHDVRDDLLRMLFVCCDDGIPTESQLVFALKTLCGFDIREIAERLFISEANVYKRLGRARGRLRERPLTLKDLSDEQLASRLPAVQSILYLLFTEGYLSSNPAEAIRRELCDEAKRLTRLLAEHPLGRSPTTSALMALMHLHSARMTARQDGSGGLLLLEEQDRSQWDQAEIQTGLEWLALSAEGGEFSRFHAEAGIAAEHCLAPSFGETRWERIVACYELLESLAPSALHSLNRALAVAEWRGPAEGLHILEGLIPPPWLADSYMWSAALSDLHRRCGNLARAQDLLDTALASAPSAAVKEALMRRSSDAEGQAGGTESAHEDLLEGDRRQCSSLTPQPIPAGSQES